MKLKAFFYFVFCVTILAATDVVGQVCEAFLPDIMNQYPNVRDITISSDNNELYFSVQSYKKEFSSIVKLVKESNNWQKPEIVSFSGQYCDIEPALDMSGLRLYFASNRPKNDTAVLPGDYDIWYVKRRDLNSAWSDPINVGSVINTTKNEFFPSVAANGNLYFTAEASNAKEDIYVSKFIDGKYTAPVALPKNINSDNWEFNAYIAPDELFLIFSSFGRDDSFGGGDLYISFKDKDNNWLPAENLGSIINTGKLDYCPFVDIKSNILYFTSEKSEIQNFYSNKKDLREILIDFNSFPNGLSRIYSIPFPVVAK